MAVTSVQAAATLERLNLNSEDRPNQVTLKKIKIRVLINYLRIQPSPLTKSLGRMAY